MIWLVLKNSFLKSSISWPTIEGTPHLLRDSAKLILSHLLFPYNTFSTLISSKRLKIAFYEYVLLVGIPFWGREVTMGLSDLLTLISYLRLKIYLLIYYSYCK